MIMGTPGARRRRPRGPSTTTCGFVILLFVWLLVVFVRCIDIYIYIYIYTHIYIQIYIYIQYIYDYMYNVLSNGSVTMARLCLKKQDKRKVNDVMYVKGLS